MLELEGKRALVTGAGRRVGAEIAAALGEQRMHVAVHYQSSHAGAVATCERVRSAGGRASLLSADLRDRDLARSLVDRAIALLGGLDLLVLSAASYEHTPLAAIDAANLDSALDLNLTAPSLIALRAREALRATRGNIVFITDTSRVAPYRDFLAYETSKAGLHQVMRLLALELAPEVRVNAVAPGSVLPPETWSEAERSELTARIPLGRFGTPRDVADAVVHLAQSEWITGVELPVDGGRTLV